METHKVSAHTYSCVCVYHHVGINEMHLTTRSTKHGVCVLTVNLGINAMHLTIRTFEKPLHTKCRINVHQGHVVLKINKLDAPRPCTQALAEHASQVITTYIPPPHVCEIPCFITVDFAGALVFIMPLTRTAIREEMGPSGWRPNGSGANMQHTHRNAPPILVKIVKACPCITIGHRVNKTSAILAAH